jgi:hypothetical protein
VILVSTLKLWHYESTAISGPQAIKAAAPQPGEKYKNRISRYEVLKKFKPVSKPHAHIK